VFHIISVIGIAKLARHFQDLQAHQRNKSVSVANFEALWCILLGCMNECSPRYCSRSPVSFGSNTYEVFKEIVLATFVIHPDEAIVIVPHSIGPGF
jgi:hypothetical protein